MVFFADLLNIESSQFKTISKPTTVKEFSTENHNITALNELFSKLNNDEKKEVVNKEIIAIGTLYRVPTSTINLCTVKNR